MDRRAFLRATTAAALAAGCGTRLGEAELSPRVSEMAVATTSPAPTPAAVTSPSVAATAFEVICRDSLGLPAPKPDARAQSISGLMIHHTASGVSSAAAAPGALRGHTNYHRDQGWPDIAYHLGVDLNGNVYELRSPTLPGDTFTNYDPTGWFLVVAEGNYSNLMPTDAMLTRFAEIFAWASVQYGAPVETLSGHRDHAQTSCPGDNLYAALPEIRAAALDLGGTSNVQRLEVCGDAGQQRVADIEAGRV